MTQYGGRWPQYPKPCDVGTLCADESENDGLAPGTSWVAATVKDTMEVLMTTRLYVGNLPYTVNEGELNQLFGQAGKVESVSIPTDRETGRPRGFGFVDMATSEEAENGIRMFNGYTLDGRQLRVNIAREREERGPRFGERRRGGY